MECATYSSNIVFFGTERSLPISLAQKPNGIPLKLTRDTKFASETSEPFYIRTLIRANGRCLHSLQVHRVPWQSNCVAKWLLSRHVLQAFDHSGSPITEPISQQSHFVFTEEGWRLSGALLSASGCLYLRTFFSTARLSARLCRN